MAKVKNIPVVEQLQDYKTFLSRANDDMKTHFDPIVYGTKDEPLFDLKDLERLLDCEAKSYMRILHRYVKEVKYIGRQFTAIQYEGALTLVAVSGSPCALILHRFISKLVMQYFSTGNVDSLDMVKSEKERKQALDTRIQELEGIYQAKLTDTYIRTKELEADLDHAKEEKEKAYDALESLQDEYRLCKKKIKLIMRDKSEQEKIKLDSGSRFNTLIEIISYGIEQEHGTRKQILQQNLNYLQEYFEL